MLTKSEWREGIPTRAMVEANERTDMNSGELISPWMARPAGGVTPMVIVGCWEERENNGGPCLRWDAMVTPRADDPTTWQCIRVYPTEAWAFFPLCVWPSGPRAWGQIDAAVSQ